MSTQTSPSDAPAGPAPQPDYDAWRARIRADTSARYHLAMGDALQKEGSHAAAVDAYRRAIATLPSLCTAHDHLVDLLRGLRRDDEAEAVHRAALALNPVYRDEAFASGAIDRAQQDGDYAAAVDALAEASARLPNDTRLAAYHALALFSAGRIAEGRSVFSTVAARLAGGSLDELAEEYRKEANEKLWVRPWTPTSFDEAIALIGCAVTLGPEDFAPPADLCFAWYVLQRPEPIIAFVEGNPQPAAQTVFTRGRKGWAHLMLGQWAEGEATLRAILDEKPPHDAFINYVVAGMGMAIHLGGRTAEAVALLDRNIADHPADFYALRVRAMIDLAQDRPEAALQKLETAAHNVPALTSALSDMGLCWQALGDLDRAEALHRDALASAGTKTRYLIPDDPWVMLNLSLVLDAKGRTTEAEAIHRTCLAGFQTLQPFLIAQLPPWAAAAALRIQERIAA